MSELSYFVWSPLKQLLQSSFSNDKSPCLPIIPAQGTTLKALQFCSVLRGTQLLEILSDKAWRLSFMKRFPHVQLPSPSLLSISFASEGLQDLFFLLCFQRVVLPVSNYELSNPPAQIPSLSSDVCHQHSIHTSKLPLSPPLLPPWAVSLCCPISLCCPSTLIQQIHLGKGNLSVAEGKSPFSNKGGVTLSVFLWLFLQLLLCLRSRTDPSNCQPLALHKSSSWKYAAGEE